MIIKQDSIELLRNMSQIRLNTIHHLTKKNAGNINFNKLKSTENCDAQATI